MPLAEPVEIKIWHDGDEAIMQTIADQVNKQLAEDGITVTFEKKSGMPDQLKLYGNDPVNGPDMYLYAHDTLGTFVAMDILAPITDVVDASVLKDAQQHPENYQTLSVRVSGWNARFVTLNKEWQDMVIERDTK